MSPLEIGRIEFLKYYKIDSISRIKLVGFTDEETIPLEYFCLVPKNVVKLRFFYKTKLIGTLFTKGKKVFAYCEVLPNDSAMLRKTKAEFIRIMKRL